MLQGILVLTTLPLSDWTLYKARYLGTYLGSQVPEYLRRMQLMAAALDS